MWLITPKIIDYNSSNFTPQGLLWDKFYDILRYIKEHENNSEEFEQFVKEYINPQQTLLRKFNILLYACMDSLEDFQEFYFETLKGILSFNQKLDALFIWLKNYYEGD